MPTSFKNRRLDLVAYDKEYNTISSYRRNGINAEQVEDMDSALRYYLESIKIGEDSKYDILHAFRFCYDRAIALCRQFKIRYKEIELIENLIRHNISSKDKEKYLRRLKDLAS